MLLRWNFFLLVGVLFSSMTPSMFAGEWGTLTGRFVYDGEPPQPQIIVPNKDVAVCGKEKIIDERLVVNEENRGIVDILIYLRKKPSRISVEQEALFQQPVTLDNIGCRYEPHVLLVRTGQPLLVGNKDAVGHNTNLGGLLNNAAFNVILPALGTHEVIFNAAERRPVQTGCNIHSWMMAVVLIKDHPYMAKTDKNGQFKILALPTGEELDIQFWHQGGGYIRDVSGANAKVNRKGRVQLTLKGDFDLGVVKVAPENFQD